jgi:hypothetical protein
MSKTQARMTALVDKALDATIKDLGGIDLDGLKFDDRVDCCNQQKVAEVLTGHLCALLYPKQDPEAKEG